MGLRRLLLVDNKVDEEERKLIVLLAKKCLPSFLYSHVLHLIGLKNAASCISWNTHNTLYLYISVSQCQSVCVEDCVVVEVVSIVETILYGCILVHQCVLKIV